MIPATRLSGTLPSSRLVPQQACCSGVSYMPSSPATSVRLAQCRGRCKDATSQVLGPAQDARYNAGNACTMLTTASDPARALHEPHHIQQVQVLISLESGSLVPTGTILSSNHHVLMIVLLCFCSDLSRMAAGGAGQPEGPVRAAAAGPASPAAGAGPGRLSAGCRQR